MRIRLVVGYRLLQGRYTIYRNRMSVCKLILYFTIDCAFSSLIVFLNLGPNTRNYEWASWEAWSQCSITCGGQGTKIRNRACVPPSNGGFACPSSKETETATCEELKCPGRQDQF